MIDYAFIDRVGRPGSVVVLDGEMSGISHRISANEATRLLATHGDALPFEVTAMLSGEGRDSVRLSVLDLELTSLGVGLVDAATHPAFSLRDTEGVLRSEMDASQWRCPSEDAEHWEKTRLVEDGETWVLCGACGTSGRSPWA
jgi:hypothetical protein